MKPSSEAIDAATKQAIRSGLFRASAIVVFVRCSGLRVGDRDIDRSLQRLRKRGDVKFVSKSGWSVR